MRSKTRNDTFSQQICNLTNNMLLNGQEVAKKSNPTVTMNVALYKVSGSILCRCNRLNLWMEDPYNN